MEIIKAYLDQLGVDASDADIVAKCEELNIDINGEIAKDDAASIAQLIANDKNSGGRLAKSSPNGGKATKGKTTKTNGKRLNKQNQLAASVQQSIDNIVQVVEDGSERFADEYSDHLVQIVKNTPTRVLETFAQKAEAEASNPELFRNEAQGYADLLFPRS